MNDFAITAVGLLSGGLDSTLAAKLMLEQGIEVHAINFSSPFCTCTPKSAGCPAAVTAVKELGNIKLKQTALREAYLQMVQQPQYGYGAGLNPCIDCRIMKIRKAGDFMRKIGAKFLFTGEVLGQRPMSQHRGALKIIDRESGFGGYILRPLSAAHFEPTIPEQRGWVDRKRLLAITGRSRKVQIALASERGILNYPCPAGGCLLTDKNFAHRMRDYFAHSENPSMRDIPLLKVGRHFRLENGDKVIVAHDQHECKAMDNLCRENEHLLRPLDFSGPTVILQGTLIEAAIAKMKQYTKAAIPEAARVIHRYKGKTRNLFLRDKEYCDGRKA